MATQAPVTAPTPVKPVEHHTAPGGVMYVGPSLTRSLYDFARALRDASA